MSILPIACFSTLSTGIVRLSTAQPVSILKQHRHIMSNSEERNNAEYRYAPYRKHPELFGDTFPDEWLHSDMHQIAKALKNATTIDSCVDPKALTPFLHEEGSQIYSFNCLSPIFLQLLNEELVNFYQMSEKYEIPVRRPNSMNNYGVVVNEIGMRSMITDFQQRILWPLATVLFPIQSTPRFDDHYSFIVRYTADEDLGLDMHIDDSDVTFNVCLGDSNFTGATLVFCGMFGAQDHRQVSHTYYHQVGRAVLHLGSRRHGAEDISSGTRTNLIVWNHNWNYRQSTHYKRLRNLEDYQVEQGPPDPLCLSYTHDRDYSRYKTMSLEQQGHPWCPPPGKEYKGYYDDETTDT